METKKCKFCGKEAVLSKDYFDGKFYINCINGDCQDEHIKEIPNKPFDTEEEAIEWWNKMQESE